MVLKPTERADRLRDAWGYPPPRSAQTIAALLPPGASILTVEEVATVVNALTVWPNYIDNLTQETADALRVLGQDVS